MRDHGWRQVIAKELDPGDAETGEGDEGASPLRVVREYRALTQIELARRTGVKPSHISAIENGRRAGTTQPLLALAKALGAPLGVLAGE